MGADGDLNVGKLLNLLGALVARLAFVLVERHETSFWSCCFKDAGCVKAIDVYQDLMKGWFRLAAVSIKGRKHRRKGVYRAPSISRRNEVFPFYGALSGRFHERHAAGHSR